MTRIAIIGAGVSGLVLAQQLAAHAQVSVFEKARGVGGRMSTRYADPFYFDHGTQYFTARSRKFRTFLKPYIAAGVVQPWAGKVVTLSAAPSGPPNQTKRLWFETHFVASPHMNSLCKALATNIHVQTGCEVAPLAARDPQGWRLQNKDGDDLGHFDWVISTAPPLQTVRLFGAHLPAPHPLHQVALLGCYTLMLGFNKPWHKKWIAAKITDSPFDWLSVNSSKPGRNALTTCLVAHTHNDWAEAHIDDDMTQAQTFLLQQFTRSTGIDTADADFITTHRWRYASVANTVGTEKKDDVGSYCNNALGLAAVGDWCAQSRIEQTWHHADALAEQIRQRIGRG